MQRRVIVWLERQLARHDLEAILEHMEGLPHMGLVTYADSRAAGSKYAAYFAGKPELMAANPGLALPEHCEMMVTGTKAARIAKGELANMKGVRRITVGRV